MMRLLNDENIDPRVIRNGVDVFYENDNIIFGFVNTYIVRNKNIIKDNIEERIKNFKIKSFLTKYSDPTTFFENNTKLCKT